MISRRQPSWGTPAFAFSGTGRILAGFTGATRPGIILGLQSPAGEVDPMTDVMTNATPSSAQGELSRQGELGDFLRSRRDRLTPKAVGLPDGRRRRTPGL